MKIYFSRSPPYMEKTFGNLEYAGEGKVEQRRINGRMTTLSRSYNLYSDESFTKNFVRDYYTWQNEKDSIEQRVEKVSSYLTENLQALNTDAIRDDIPTSSSVSGFDIWSVSPENDNT